MKSALRLGILSMALPLAGCGLFDPKPNNSAYDVLAVVPQEFLFTDYQPLNDWLDTPIRVQIMDVKLLDVFQHPALRGLNYKITVPPRDNPTLLIDKMAMTRRQLLWSISHDYALMFTPVFGESAQLAWIDIRSKESAAMGAAASSKSGS